MPDILHGSWSFTDPGDDVPDGSVIRGGNCEQLVPDTPILVGKKLTIYGGKFVNVRKDPNWTILGGNWTQVPRCSHKHPEWIERGLQVCADDCGHRSKEKRWQVVDVEEFRKARRTLDVQDVEIDNEVDGDGVHKQTFRRRIYTYREVAIR